MISTTGYPAKIPCSIASRTPFSTAGIYCLGIAPPKILLSNSNSFPRSSGSTSNQQCPYWPCPPVCFLYFPSTFVFFVIVSLYGNLGVVSSIFTLYLFLSFSTITERCVSPIPEIIWSLVSAFLETFTVGSSSVILERPMLILSSSAFVLGHIAFDSIGSGNLIGGYTIGIPLSERVSLV